MSEEENPHRLPTWWWSVPVALPQTVWLGPETRQGTGLPTPIGGYGAGLLPRPLGKSSKAGFVLETVYVLMPGALVCNFP